MNMAEENRKWLLLYSGLTGLCYLFDALTFVIVLRWFSVAGKEHSELLMLFATLINFGIDMYYLIWVMQLKSKLPPKMGTFVSDAILGYTKKLTRELYHNLDRSDRPNVQAARASMAADKEKAKSGDGDDQAANNAD